MKTTAIWIVASIFGGIAVVLAQINCLTFSIVFGSASVVILLFSLIVHRSESKKGIIKPDLKIELIPTPSFGHIRAPGASYLKPLLMILILNI